MMKVTLQHVIEEISLLGFETTLLAGSLILLIGGLISGREELSKIVYSLTLMTAIFAVDFISPKISDSGSIYNDQINGLFKVLFAFISLWIIFFRVPNRRYEHYLLLLSIVLGSSLMMSANHLLLFYLAIELTSISSYLITGFSFRKSSFEAAIKYLLFGGVSSAIMIYGISLIYGLSGSMIIHEIEITPVSGPLYHVAMICIIGGLFFKVGLVPYQFWVPSTYQEAPTDGVAILSIVPKIAGFVLIHRIVTDFQLVEEPVYFNAFAAFGLITVIFGTLGALRQKNLKRLLAYGAIAHSGLILPTLLIGGEQGGLSFTWYVVVYAIMTMGIFMIVSMYEDLQVNEVEDMKGIGIRYPMLGSLTLLILVAQIGLPPTAGFTAKFYLFSALWGEYQVSGSIVMMTYLVVGLVSVVLALFYYLKIPYHSFLGMAKTRFSENLSIIPLVIVTIFTIMVLWLFIKPELLNKIAFNINFINW